MQQNTNMYMNYLYLFSILFLSTISSLTYAGGNEQEADSIMNIINKATGKEKLELLDHYSGLYQNNMLLTKELKDEASKQNNQLYLSLANRKMVYYYATKGNRDSMKLYLDKTNEHLSLFIQEGKYESSSDKDKEKYKTTKVMVVATKATLFIDEGKYNLALNEIKKGLNDSIICKTDIFRSQAYSLVGIAYLYTKKPSEALDNFRKTIEIESEIESRKGSKDSYAGKYRYYSAMEGSTIAYNFLDKYDEAILLADSLSSKIEEEYKHCKTLRGDNSDDDFKYKFFKNRILCYSAQANIKKGNAKTAREQLDEVKQFVAEISTSSIHQDFDIYYLIETDYYLSVGNHEKAKEYASLLTNKVSIKKQPYSYLQSNLYLSKTLNAGGKSKEAYDLLYRLYNTNDSINAINFSNEFAEMQTKHELKEAGFLVKEANLKLKNARMILLVLTVFFLLSLLVVYIIWKNKKLLKNKNLLLYKQYKEIELRNKRIVELQSTHNDITTDSIIDEDVYGVIMEKLIQYFSESKAYLNSDITRESIALAIGTNRQYLIEAIKEKTGKTFNEFIYSYRLKHAYELIVSNNDQTISDILEKSGFHSKATFYNAFKDAYGMTPSELRNILN